MTKQKKISLLVLVILLLAITFLYFTRTLNNAVGTDDMPLRDPKSLIDWNVLLNKNEQSCIQNGGVWRKFGENTVERCDLPMSDGGKICSDDSQCQGSCIATLTSAEEKLVISGKSIPKNGICTSWANSGFGCHPFVVNGKVDGILCAD